MTALGDHVIAETDYLGIPEPERGNLIDIVGAFAASTDIPGALEKVLKLLRFESITPLTNDPASWLDRSETGSIAVVPGQKVWQSARNPDAWTYDENFGSYFLLSAMNTGSPQLFPTEPFEP